MPVPTLSPNEVEQAADAARLVVEVHRRLADWLRVGQTLAVIDSYVASVLADLKTKSAFIGYRPGLHPAFPSHACLSPNEVIVHGTAGMRTEPLEAGDLLSIDIGVSYRGWKGDAAFTYVFEQADEETERLCRCAQEALHLGIEKLQPGAALVDWARVVQHHVEEEYGFHCVEGLGGHGYGRELHQSPYVANTAPRFSSEWPDANFCLEPGHLLAVEPMVAVGTPEKTQRPRSWPIMTADGSRAAHYEHDVLITDEGPRVLTKGLDELPLIVG